jgi:hypothetical protein
MRFSKSVLIAFSALAFATASNAASSQRDNEGNVRGAAPPYSSFAADRSGYASSAEVAVFVDSENVGTANAIHVSSVTRPFTGTYCIKPSVHLKHSAIYPQVTIEWGTSTGGDMSAYIEGDNFDCGADNTSIEVITYTTVSGTTSPSNNVSFYLFVK